MRLVFLALQVSNNFRWIQYTTILLDTTLVTAALASLMVIGRGILATNSQTTFLLYFFVLGMAGRRYDVPLAVFMGRSSFWSTPPWSFWATSPTTCPRGCRSRVWSLQLAGAVRKGGRAGRERGDDGKYGHQFQASSRAVHRDPLLGIYNRRYFEEVLALEFEYSCKLGRSLTLGHDGRGPVQIL